MPTLPVTVGATSLSAIEAFAQANKGAIRARHGAGGTVVLYTKVKTSRLDIFLTKKQSAKREAKRALAENTIFDAIKAKIGDGGAKAALAGGIRDNKHEVTGAKVFAALSQNVDQGRAELAALKQLASKDFNDGRTNMAFQKVMSEPQLRSAFEDHAERQLVSENTNFYSAMEHLEQKVADGAPISEIRAEADSMRREFFGNAANQPINVDDFQAGLVVKTDFTKLDGKQILAAFTPAKDFVTDLLTQDPLAKFLKATD